VRARCEHIGDRGEHISFEQRQEPLHERHHRANAFMAALRAEGPFPSSIRGEHGLKGAWIGFQEPESPRTPA